VALIRDELAEHGQEHRFAEFYGKTASMFQIALSISALIGGFIAAKSFAYVLWASVIPQIVCVIISLQITERKPKINQKVLVSANYWTHLKESAQLFLKNPRIRLISIGQITSYGIGEIMFQFYPVFVAMLWPVWALGIFRMLDNGLAALGFWFAGKILKKYDKIKSLIAGKVLSALTDLPAVLFPSVISPVLISFSSFFFGLAATARGDLLQKEYSSAHRATMDSLNSLGGSIFMAICALIFGIFADRIGAIKSLIIGEILVFLTVIFYIWLKKYYKINSPVKDYVV
jgi:predicted MFS family arabinose efflux permease